MSRVQLALNVSDIDQAVAFYSKLFGTEPAKVRPGYANFAIAEPPLKLILFAAPGKGGTINHLGVEVFSAEEVARAGDRLVEAGLVTRAEENVTCCYATQDKVWVTGPDGEEWETYTVFADAEQLAPDRDAEGGPVVACCQGLEPGNAEQAEAACC